MSIPTYDPENVCQECDAEITGEPVQDSEQVWWVGADKANRYCSKKCLNRAAEAYFERRSEEVY